MGLLYSGWKFWWPEFDYESKGRTFESCRAPTPHLAMAFRWPSPSTEPSPPFDRIRSGKGTISVLAEVAGLIQLYFLDAVKIGIRRR